MKPSMSWIEATYRVSGPRADAERAARWIAVEQTVEAPGALIDARIERDCVGRVTAVVEAERGFDVTIAFAAELAHGQLPQLLNLLFGLTAMRADTRLVGLELPETLLAGFRGPRRGLRGVRAMLGVERRPLLATALKPRGADPERLAAQAREFVLGGGDLVKDDHNLVHDDAASFRARVTRLRDAVREAAAQRGRRCLYLPNLCAPLGELERHLEIVLELGLEGVMVAPFVLGLDTLRHFADRYDLLFLTHPSLAGPMLCHPDHGIHPAILLGTLVRLAGADISVFGSFGGRYTVPPGECRELAGALRGPLGALEPALPGPAGGMRPELFEEMARVYGPDTLLLLGGSLLAAPKGVLRATEACCERIETCFRS